MKYSVKFLHSAVVDNNANIEYLSQFYPSTPRKYLTALEKRKSTLVDNPYFYSVYLPMPEYRRFTVRNYIGFYKIIEESSTVEIHRILHGSRDVVSALNG